jgi:hypothetical protein
VSNISRVVRSLVGRDGPVEVAPLATPSFKGLVVVLFLPSESKFSVRLLSMKAQLTGNLVRQVPHGAECYRTLTQLSGQGFLLEQHTDQSDQSLILLRVRDPSNVFQVGGVGCARYDCRNLSDRGFDDHDKRHANSVGVLCAESPSGCRQIQVCLS